MSSAHPALAPAPKLVTAQQICSLAADRCHIASAAVTSAFGSISNLYCMYGLEHPRTGTVKLKDFSTPVIAPRDAVLQAIRNAVPGLSKAKAESILSALSDALDLVVQKMPTAPIRIDGYGTFQRTDGAYDLTLELPLNRFLSRTRGE